jgi:hypothetical protein
MGFEVQRVDSLPGMLEKQVAAAGNVVGPIARKFAAAWRLQSERLDACGVPALALIVLPAINVLITIVWLQLSVLTPKYHDIAIALVIWTGFAGIAMLASWFDLGRPITGVLGTTAVILGGFASSSFPSALGTAMGTPLWDAAFMRFDTLLGFNHVAIYDWLVQWPEVVNVMTICYSSTVKFVLLTGMLLVILSRIERLREFNLLFASTLTIVVFVAALVPAAGLLTEVRFSSAVLAALPEGAGTYHLELFHALRAGLPMDYGPFDNPGLIVFPSFHSCMAILVLYAFRDDPVMKWAAGGNCAITLVATVPYGSHYVADIVGGAAICAMCAWALRARAAGLPAPAQSQQMVEAAA